MKYENTKIYFKNCDYSLHFFNIKTYSFQKTCYKKCPDLTTLNTVSEECGCTYYKYYLDLTKTEFKCLNENEQCKDYSQFSIISKKECASESECINQNYKIFNSFCYDSCPENTEENNNYCGCKFLFYIDGNEYFCFPEGKSCGDTDHPIESNTKRCFLSKENCIVESNKFLIIYVIYLHVLLIQTITMVMVFVLALIFFIKICPQTYMFALIKMKNVLQKDIILK